MSVYLDASVLLPIILPEPGSAAVDRYIGSATSALWVSEFAVAEVGAAISRLVRMQFLDEARAGRKLADFDAWRAADATLIDVEGSDVRLAGVIVRRFELMLRAPDALHIAICQRLNASLMTLDRRLAIAAGKLGVEAIAL